MPKQLLPFFGVVRAFLLFGRLAACTVVLLLSSSSRCCYELFSPFKALTGGQASSSLPQHFQSSGGALLTLKQRKVILSRSTIMLKGHLYRHRRFTAQRVCLHPFIPEAVPQLHLHVYVRYQKVLSSMKINRTSQSSRPTAEHLQSTLRPSAHAALPYFLAKRCQTPSSFNFDLFCNNTAACHFDSYYSSKNAHPVQPVTEVCFEFLPLCD